MRPPQAGAQRESEQRRHDQPGVDGQPLRADPDSDDRLADRDQHDQTVSLDEVAGLDHEAGVVDQLRRDPFEAERRRPRGRTAPSRPRLPPATTRSAVDRLNGARPRMAWTTLICDERANIPMWMHDHGEVGEPEDGAAAREGARHGERDDEEAGHPSEQRQTPRDAVQGDRVRQPRVAAVHPEDHAEHHRDLQQPLPARFVTSTAVSCVIVKTNTRSKNSSRVETRVRSEDSGKNSFIEKTPRR